MNNEKFASEQEFRKFYDKELLPLHQILEQKRLKCLTWFCFIVISVILLCLTVWFLCRSEIISPSLYRSESFVKICGVITVIVVGFIFFPYFIYDAESHKKTISAVLSFWKYIKYFQGLPLIKSEKLEKSGLFLCFDRQDVDDAFTGSYHHVEFTVSEQEMSWMSRHRERVIFAGLCILLQFDHCFKGRIIMKQKGGWRTLLLHNLLTLILLLAPALLAFGVWLNGKSVNLTDVAFVYFVIISVLLLFLGIPYLRHFLNIRENSQEKCLKKMETNISFLHPWIISADNDCSVRRELTSTLITKLVHLREIFYGNLIDVSFAENKVLICIHTMKNLFAAPSLFAPTLNYDRALEIFRQISAIFTVIDELNSKK